MASFFCDSSAIVKRYVNEKGSNFVDSLADLKIGNVILLARITRVEIAAAIARRLKGGSITTTDAQNAIVAFQHDLTNNYFTVEITDALLSRAMSLATKHALRGYDAVQLAAALEAADERIANQLPPLTLVSADDELNTAARAESLNVENPNDYP
ncbi:MAG: type II toxin-antitoxin system VapC family toxin [Acidobacteriota bacterium]|nr:type II toxin-antitoxin system VapC family toxin [Acidobacteriota bacterium]